MEGADDRVACNPIADRRRDDQGAALCAGTNRRAPPRRKRGRSGTATVRARGTAADACDGQRILRRAQRNLALPNWQRLRDGALLATSTYVNWASLLQRTFEVDVLRCAKCGGSVRVLSVITDREAIRRILSHVGTAPDPVPLPRARDPDDDVALVAAADNA
jgi:hypothetical protein